jgi:hypothetical protein
MPSVFHYTDSAGLLGILSSKSLFATDYRYLNDVTEGSMIRQLILPIFEAEIAEITPKLLAQGFLQKRIYDDYGAEIHRLQAEGVYRAFVKTLDLTSPLFVLSFCKHTEPKTIEHGLLSQWRAYAGSAGFAIEFDEVQLDALMNDEITTFAFPAIRSTDVLYTEYAKLFDPTAYSGVAGEVIRLSFEPQDASKITGRKELDPVFVDFCKTAPFLKHEGFEEEKEYRIAAGRLSADKIQPGAPIIEKEIKFRSKDGLVIPYIEFFKNSKHALPITSIIVGPHPSQDKQEAAVRMALDANGFSKATVRLSEIPFRR